MRIALRIATLLALALPTGAQVPNPGPPNPAEIDVDQDCRIVTIDLRDPAKPRVRHRSDSGICYIDGGARRSMHWETTILNGKAGDFDVEVIEREYVLHNPYPQRVTFLVKQQLLKKHHIDSDPKPDQVVGSIATFRVVTEPNQTTRLHVGESNKP